MKYSAYLFMSLLFWSCSKSQPDCLASEILAFQEAQASCLGASIVEYSFQGNRVYGFSDGECIIDGGTTILDENCEQLCFIGGILFVISGILLKYSSGRK